MNKISFLFLFLLMSCAQSSSKDELASETQIISPEIISWTDEYMTLVNDHRLEMGLLPLILDEGLAQIVKLHSENMASGKVSFGHDGFSSRCDEGKDIIGGGNWCGENVASGRKSPEEVFNAWMKSSGHKANIEKARATHTGFSYAKNTKGSYYWTQIFLEH